jgi:hypothetical protein
VVFDPINGPRSRRRLGRCERFRDRAGEGRLGAGLQTGARPEKSSLLRGGVAVGARRGGLRP